MSKEKITEIDEAIADAIAEEEVKREQIKAEAETRAEASATDFREELKKLLKKNFSEETKKNSVTLDLNEYLILKFKERDLEILVATILSNLRLSYDKEYLWLEDREKVVNVINVLYPDVYDELLETLKEEDQEE